jgi:N-acetylneuraminic acid mutarotase
MRVGLFRTCVFAAAAALAQAHFLFVVPESGGAKAKVFMSETLKPDSALGPEIISGAKLSLRGADGNEMPLTLVKGSDAYDVALSGQGTRVIHGLSDLGVFEDGSTKPYLLQYHPKAILGDAFAHKTIVGRQVPVEIVPIGEPGALTLLLVAHGKPLANSEITVLFPDSTQKKLKTDVDGLTEVLTQTGRYGAWARLWEPATGEHDGKKYEEVRHYATLVFDAESATTTAGITASRFAALPEAASSFGSVVSDGWLYVYGGHIAPTHQYSTEAVSGQFNRLHLTGSHEWEHLPGGPAMQGMNLAVHEGKIYRAGGMTPHNAPGSPADNYSVADCARFDPRAGKWEALPPMPEPRSSHDVVVVGDLLIVVGGWAIKGSRTEWSDTLGVLDLGAQPLRWKTVKQPFKRRALMAAAFDGRMYVIGGFDDQNRIVRDVSIYDPKSDTWSESAKIPEGPGLAFAPAVGVHEGNLYVSISDGTLYRLNRSSNEWEKAGSSTPRLAHRIASAGRTVLVIGGAADGKNSDLIEAIPIESN